MHTRTAHHSLLLPLGRDLRSPNSVQARDSPLNYMYKHVLWRIFAVRRVSRGGGVESSESSRSLVLTEANPLGDGQTLPGLLFLVALRTYLRTYVRLPELLIDDNARAA